MFVDEFQIKIVTSSGTRQLIKFHQEQESFGGRQVSIVPWKFLKQLRSFSCCSVKIQTERKMATFFSELASLGATKFRNSTEG